MFYSGDDLYDDEITSGPYDDSLDLPVFAGDDDVPVELEDERR